MNHTSVKSYKKNKRASLARQIAFFQIAIILLIAVCVGVVSNYMLHVMLEERLEERLSAQALGVSSLRERSGRGMRIL